MSMEHTGQRELSWDSCEDDAYGVAGMEWVEDEEVATKEEEEVMDFTGVLMEGC